MKPTTPARRSGPVQMRLFRVSTADRAREKNTSPPPSRSQLTKTTSQTMSTLPDQNEAASPPPSEGHGSSLGTNPTQTAPLPAAQSDITSPAIDEHLATPNTVRSVNDPRSPKTPASEASEGWSAVGKATISGRSGRVIERLQSDLDQAKRDNKSLQLSNDELHSSYGLLAAEVDSLRSSAETNETIVHNLQAQAGRKDRKIAELKEDLAEQKALRLKAEAAYNETVSEAETRVTDAERERTKAIELAKYYQTQYEVFSSSAKRLRDDCQQKTDQLGEKVAKCLQTIAEGEEKIAKYEVQAKECEVTIERVKQMNEHLSNVAEKYIAARDEEVASLKSRLAAHEENMAAWNAEAQKTVGSMKHVMNVKTTFKGDFQD